MGILLEKFDKFIVEHGSAAVRGDHIALLRDQLQAAEKQIEKLEAENASLKEKLSKCEAKLEALSRGEEFVEHRGALFKRKPEGGYHLTVYCPHCRKVAGTIDRNFPYSCRCGWAVDFTPADLERVLKELP
jgi:hypothetical protein